MNVTIEIMEKRIASLEDTRNKALGEINALQGRIEEAKATLAHLKAEEPTEPKANGSEPTPAPVKRGPGRPKGTGKKAKAAAEAQPQA